MKLWKWGVCLKNSPSQEPLDFELLKQWPWAEEGFKVQHRNMWEKIIETHFLKKYNAKVYDITMQAFSYSVH